MAELAPHYYVKPVESASRQRRCARPGCGRPPEDPVHLRPAGDDPMEGVLAPTGTTG